MSELVANDPPTNLEASLEALLFVAPGPVTVAQLAEALGRKSQEVEESLHNLELQYRQGRGLSLQWHAGRVQLTTAPEFSGAVEKFLGLEATARLSRAALEALAIIAYRQPITRPGVDSIRGVNSDGVMKSLLNKGLVQEVGRSEGPGRPILYGTTTEFLQHFGLSSLAELPPYTQPEAEPGPDASPAVGANGDSAKRKNNVLKD
ncbi:MAG: SMC-Scp complex subunit ScpB [Chloroflexi bacterium]|nr:MAG: SMC-Scp complex subunit ScpB [Chloroflexota bacterium]